MSTVNDYRVGNVVQTHPATDTWMRGERYGVVTRVGTKLVEVKLDRSGRLRRFRPDLLIWEMEARTCSGSSD